MYKIFINEKPFILAGTEYSDRQFMQTAVIDWQPGRVIEHIKNAEGLAGKGILMRCQDPESAYCEFCSHFVVITAAGGVVRNEQKDLLLIKRLGKWDLPKGKIDGDETPAEAAVREVEEECGIGQLRLGKQLPSTYHTYKMHNHRFLKVTYWFEMETSWAAPLIPQKEEHITEAKWVSEANLQPETLDTYMSIRDLLLSLRR